MTDRAKHDDGQGPGSPGPFDHEIDRKGIVNVGVWLAVITVVSFGVTVLFYKGLSSYEKRTLDQKPSPMREANVPLVPSGPLLQPNPESELAAFRKTERRRLDGWGWVDKSQNLAYVPVDKAIDAVAAAGLPSFTPSEPVETP